MARWGDDKVAAVRANIFPAAWESVGADPNGFPWHTQAESPRSSQALAIDVFGTIRMHPQRDEILKAIAGRLGLPQIGPWDVEPEWRDADNRLNERVQTQVDAAAVGGAAIILFEGKFTEPAGSCSQPVSRDGRPAECSGAYVPQIGDGLDGVARCALTRKGIRYWDHAMELYGIDPMVDHTPCPFRYSSYQWMRNSALAKALAHHRGKQVMVVAAYADADFFLPAADKARRGEVFGQPVLDVANAIRPMSYQQIIAIAEDAAPSIVWAELRDWVQRKIELQRPA